MTDNCSQLSYLTTKLSGGVCEGSFVQCSKYFGFFLFELTFFSNYWSCYVRSMRSTFSCVVNEVRACWKAIYRASHPILLVNNSLALTEHRLSDPSALDGADWSAMRMLTDLLIINCSLSSCEGKGNIYLRSLFKKRYMYIHRKRNKNTSKSSDLKKTTFTA